MKKPRKPAPSVSLKRLKSTLRPVNMSGAILANVAYNLAQRKDLPDDIRKTLSQCQQEWDDAIRKVPAKWRI